MINFDAAEWSLVFLPGALGFVVLLMGVLLMLVANPRFENQIVPSPVERVGAMSVDMLPWSPNTDYGKVINSYEVLSLVSW